MEIIKWEPFNELDRFFGEKSMFVNRKLGWDLAIDLYEENGSAIAKMTLPGINPDKLAIEIDKDILTISGSRVEEKEAQRRDYYSKEIRRGSFSRSIPLQHSIDAKKATAEYKDGVLVVTMPVIKGSKTNAVKVTVKNNY